MFECLHTFKDNMDAEISRVHTFYTFPKTALEHAAECERSCGGRNRTVIGQPGRGRS